MQLIVNLRRLRQYAEEKLNCSGRLETLRVTQLAGGFVAYGLYRYDLGLKGEAGLQEASFVQKFTGPAEVRVMQALSELPGDKAFPEVIDSAWAEGEENKFANWYLMPCYPGSTLTFEDEVPGEIIQSLARLHLHFYGQGERFDYLHHVEATFFRRTFDNALAILERARREKPHPNFDEAQRALTTARENRQLYEVLAALPVTLTHGDVHPGNIIQAPEMPAILIDWGNARIAPAMLDIANLIELESETWERYLAAWAEIKGEPLDSRLAYLGYHWATVIVNTQYLPYAIDFTPPENVAKMVAKIGEAQAKIAQHLREG